MKGWTTDELEMLYNGMSVTIKNNFSFEEWVNNKKRGNKNV